MTPDRAEARATDIMRTIEADPNSVIIVHDHVRTIFIKYFTLALRAVAQDCAEVAERYGADPVKISNCATLRNGAAQAIRTRWGVQ